MEAGDLVSLTLRILEKLIELFTKVADVAVVGVISQLLVTLLHLADQVFDEFSSIVDPIFLLSFSIFSK